MRRAASPVRVLLADDRGQRARTIRDALQFGWAASVEIVETVQQAKESHRAARDRGEPFQVVMIADGFAGVNCRPLFADLAGRTDTIGVLILAERDSAPEETPIKFVVVIPIDVDPTDEDLIRELRQFMREPPREPPELQNVADLGLELELQVRWLDPDGDLERSIAILRRLVGLLVSPEVDGFWLEGLTQGLSGAKVFRVRYEDPACGDQPVEEVLKLTPSVPNQSWKAYNELESYEEIDRDLGRTVVPAIPMIRGVRSDDSPPEPARFGGWLAVTYTYLGRGPLLLVDLERAFVDPDGCIRELQAAMSPLPVRPRPGDFPRYFLALLSKRLEEWCRNSPRVESRELWSLDEASDRGRLVFPPYCFRPFEKTRIIQSLYALASYGEYLLRGRWQAGFDTVVRCLSSRPASTDVLRPLLQEQPVLLTPVHGDLNANNVLVGLNNWAPFLIDFACYQSQGHMVQDFARLEVAVKIELMGREDENAADGRDLNIRRFKRWCEGEDWLAEWPPDDTDLPEAVPGDRFVRRACALCRYVRRRAREIHEQLVAPSASRPNFELSYNAALLYHTLRAIRYDALPFLKRILAIYSASKIMDRLAPPPVRKHDKST